MNRLLRLVAVAALLLSPTLIPISAAHAAAATGLRAGVATVDGTWHVGAAAGQYASDPSGDISDEWDPNLQHVTKASSYGVGSRLSVRALVLQSGNDAPVALVKQDLYLAQDLVTRRAAQILAADGSKVTYDNLLLSATHDHSAPYYSTPAAGVWVFQDAFDLRDFEYQARAIAHAIEHAEAGMRPAKLGATTVDNAFFQTNIVGPSIADDGTPAGYPRDENDHGVVVIRVDGTDGTPIATWMNYAQHGEGLDPTNLITADWIAPLQRDVDRATGSTLIFSQGAVGSSEGPYEGYYPRGRIPTYPDGPSAGVYKTFAHAGFAQLERGARLLADSVIKGWTDIGSNAPGVQVPMSSDLPVRMITHWIPGPLSHPYPAYGTCRTAPTVNGDPGVGTVPDCTRIGENDPTGEVAPIVPQTHLWENLTAAGLPIPDSYAGSSYNTVEENMRIKLQAVRLGDILLASCSCEPQVDLVKNLESRLDDVSGNIYDGYDYVNDQGDPAHNGCLKQADGTWTCKQPNAGSPGGVRVTTGLADGLIKKMQAEVHNNATGWDDPANVLTANSEPLDPSKIFGNFTKTELSPSSGFHLVVGLGHTGDYDGYTVSYREFQSRESYRKSLTSYGGHTADYMNTHLLDLARYLRDGTPIPAVPNQAQGDADEQREQHEATVLGELGSFYYDAWDTSRPDDAGPATVTSQPAPTMQRFGAATLTFRGGNNWTDNPTVGVQRLLNGVWTSYADQSGEIFTSLHPPAGVTDIATDETGGQEWLWTATFEAFDAWPRADVDGGQVPNGTYRFLVDGNIHQGGKAVPYHLQSDSVTVTPWEGLTATDPSLLPGGDVSLSTSPVAYPRSYAPDASLRLIADDGRDLPGSSNPSVLCRTCTFRPWARTGTVASVHVSVARNGQLVRTLAAVKQPDGTWHAATALAPGEIAFVQRTGVRDSYGEINGTPTRAVGTDGLLVVAPDLNPSADVPETPWTLLLPLAGALVGGFVLLRRRRA